MKVFASRFTTNFFDISGKNSNLTLMRIKYNFLSKNTKIKITPCRVCYDLQF